MLLQYTRYAIKSSLLLRKILLPIKAHCIQMLFPDRSSPKAKCGIRDKGNEKKLEEKTPGQYQPNAATAGGVLK